MIYLDYNATTPIAPEVAEAMRPFLTGGFGNPSSAHALGREAREAIERARGEVAALLGARPAEIVFTSGGTEAGNAAIKGVASAWESGAETGERGRHGLEAGAARSGEHGMEARATGARPPGHIITSVVEHPATSEPCRFLERQGWRITRVGVDSTGLVDPDDVRRAIRPDTALISIMHAQNEVGTIEPIDQIGRIAKAAGVLFHTDAAQSAGKIPVRVDELNVDFLSIAGHKLYAPKGVGALFIRDGVRVEPLMHGAGHESGRRAGTESTLLIVGLGAACELARDDLGWHGQAYSLGRAAKAQSTSSATTAYPGTPSIRALRDLLHQRLSEQFGGHIALNGHSERRLPNTLNVSFVGRIGADILANLDEICASTGSACHAGEHQPSAVLTAMGLPAERALGAIRFSLGHMTTLHEIEMAARQICSGERGG